MKNLSYEFGERQVLTNINLSIPQGSFTAFVGKSGSGKIFGTELSQIEPCELYKFCTYISHRDWIFKGSISDCLLEGRAHATEKEMWNVLEQVNLKDFILQNGDLNSQIREDATNENGMLKGGIN